MALRKEQVLLLVTVAFTVWWAMGLKPTDAGRRPRPKIKELPAVATPRSILADPTGTPTAVRELFVEPSESQPLPPKADLPFYPLGTLPVVVLPLEIGQQPRAYFQLRHVLAMAPASSSKEPKSEPKDAGSEQPKSGNGNPAPKPGPAAPTNPNTASDPSLVYDCLHKDGSKFWGIFLGKDTLKYDIAMRRSVAPGTEFRFQWINPKDGTTHDELKVKVSEITKLELARTLRNEVGLRTRGLEPRSTNVEQQRDLLFWLLETAQVEPWVYDVALERVESYRKFVTPKEHGYLYRAKVLAAMGDLAAEYRMFKDIEADLQGSSFQLRGLGMVEARLGLDKLAEKHLRAAVALNKPLDPRNYAALAEFLLDRGRVVEAVEPANNAVVYKSRNDPTDADVLSFHAVKVRAMLAVGDLAGATDALPQGISSELQVRATYLGALVAYAKQSVDSALTDFESCAQSGKIDDALLGVAACKLVKGDLAAARTAFEQIADANPRLRHLAQAGLGLLLGQIEGEGNNAVEMLRASLTTDPTHPYLHYLLGRQLRRNGDLVGAVEPLLQALRLRDDFLEALAELTWVHWGLYRRNNDTGALVRAVRYVDRLVDLDQRQGGKELLFVEMQGRLHYEARDVRAARTAFERGGDRSPFCQIGLALVEYILKRGDRAEDRLQRLRRLKPDDPVRKHAEKLLGMMADHANLEQVVDRFTSFGSGNRKWGTKTNGQARPLPGTESVKLVGAAGRLSGPVYVERTMQGTGRLVSVAIDMMVGADNRSEFAGLVVQIPGSGANAEPQFRVRFGMDDSRKVVLDLTENRKAKEPIRTSIEVTPGQWHTLRLRFATDPENPRQPTLFLHATFDGNPVLPKPLRMAGVRRNASTSGTMQTRLQADCVPLQPLDVQFRDYRRVQLKE
ncbi:MAG: tetratricopeptide repeat protein [Planctomycetes bacterium]|nr:tetratricopeptide repeat protein [Planctomycetota bacterium]